MPGSSLLLLAGGASRRFGTDKLDALVGERTLLEIALVGVDPATTVVVVGPPRILPREVRWAREDPPGAGPARAVHAGLLALTLTEREQPVVVLPGDAPAGAEAVTPLLAALAAGEAPGVVGAGPDGRLEPLHLALGPAAVRAVRADPPPVGGSARDLVARLGLVPCALPAASVRDVDVPADLPRSP
ncbi:hypothetical protein GCM10028777_18840 [Angustibacter speluncae]